MSKILITSIFITGCGQSPYYAPVSDTRQPPSRKVDYHTVARGETLYSIAWRYNLDYKKLAKANRLDSSYTIFPGQRLHLTEVRVPPPVTPSKETKEVNESRKVSVSSPERSKKETPGAKKTDKKKIRYRGSQVGFGQRMEN